MSQKKWQSSEQRRGKRGEGVVSWEDEKGGRIVEWQGQRGGRVVS